MIVEIASQYLIQSCPVLLCRNIWWESGNSLRQQKASLTTKQPAWTFLIRSVSKCTKSAFSMASHIWEQRRKQFSSGILYLQSENCLLRRRTLSYPSRKALSPFLSVSGMNHDEHSALLPNRQEESVMVYTSAHLVECLPVVKKDPLTRVTHPLTRVVTHPIHGAACFGQK